DGAVLPVRSMQNGEDHIDASTDRSGRLGHLHRTHRPALLHVARGDRRRLLGSEHPAPVLIDANRYRLKAVAIEVFEDGRSRHDGDFVLSGAAAIDHADAQFHACDNKWGRESFVEDTSDWCPDQMTPD